MSELPHEVQKEINTMYADWDGRTNAKRAMEIAAREMGKYKDRRIAELEAKLREVEKLCQHSWIVCPSCKLLCAFFEKAAEAANDLNY